MFRRIRTKMAIVLAVPLAIMVAGSYVTLSDTARQSRAADRQTDLATVSLGPNGLITALQNERNQAALQPIGLGTAFPIGVTDAADARHKSDQAFGRFEATVRSHGPQAVAAYQPAFEVWSGIGALRSQLDSYKGPTTTTNKASLSTASDLFQKYTVVLQAFLDADSRVAFGVDDAQLRNGVELLDVILRQSEAQSQAGSDAFLSSFEGGLAASGLRDQLAGHVTANSVWIERLAVYATGPFTADVQSYLNSASVVDYSNLLTGYVKTGTIDLSKLFAATNAGAVKTPTGTQTAANRLSTRVGAIVSAKADQIRTSARDRERLFAALAALATLLGLAITVLASRSITRPLRTLAEEADDMARHRLPEAVQSILDTPLGEDITPPEIEPIRVRSRDEVAGVARALTTVQDTAVNLAVEQTVLRRNIADSFVNLGRRNQNLITRQLELVSRLEEKATDPAALENLFHLDHLATRMRRNAESLMVLAGLAPPRQWSAPIPIEDVVRAALAEVEDYRRVELRSIEPSRIGGSATADVAHILAELLENSLASSPPSTPVEVYGRATADGYVLALVDHGIGMSAGELARANQRLAGAESFTVAPSRYLGHYVVGRLAARYGIAVRLNESDSYGVAARVKLPATIIEAPVQPSDARPPAGGSDAPRPPAWDDGSRSAPTPAVATRAPATVAATADDLPGGGGAARRGRLRSVPAPTERTSGTRRRPIRSSTRGAGAEQPAPRLDQPLTTPGGLTRRVPGANFAAGGDLRRDRGEGPPPGDDLPGLLSVYLAGVEGHTGHPSEGNGA